MRRDGPNILRDLDELSRRQRIRGAVDDRIGHRKALQNLELGSEIAAERHRLELDLVARTKNCELRAILTKDQRACRNPQRTGTVGEVETHLGKGARLQQIIQI